MQDVLVKDVIIRDIPSAKASHSHYKFANIHPQINILGLSPNSKENAVGVHETPEHLSLFQLGTVALSTYHWETHTHDIIIQSQLNIMAALHLQTKTKETHAHMKLKKIHAICFYPSLVCAKIF